MDSLSDSIDSLEVFYGMPRVEKLAEVKENILFEVINSSVDHINIELKGLLRPKIKYGRKILND